MFYGLYVFIAISTIAALLLEEENSIESTDVAAACIVGTIWPFWIAVLIIKKFRG